MKKGLVLGCLALFSVTACARGPSDLINISPKTEAVATETTAVDPVIEPVETTPSTEATAEAPPLDTNTAAREKKSGVLGFLKRKDKTEPESASALPGDNAELEAAVATALNATDDPIIAQDAAPDAPQSPSLTNAEIASTAPAPTAENAPSRRPRILGFLRKRVPGDVSAAAPFTAPSKPSVETAAVQAPVDTTPTVSMTDEEIAATANVAGAPQASRRPRVLGFLRKRVPGDVTSGGVELASASASSGGLFEDIPEDEPETTANAPVNFGVIPFGQVVKDCDIRKREMGEQVAKSLGSNQIKLFDTNPSSTTLRPQFLTGFKDGCARRVTAALGLFGSHQVHEATRYNRSNKTPYSRVDTAYEKVKNRVCNVRRGVPCPDKSAEKLAREITFVTVYRGFGATGEWMEILLHKGEIVATTIRSN